MKSILARLPCQQGRPTRRAVLSKAARHAQRRVRSHPLGKLGVVLQLRCKELGIPCDLTYPGASDGKYKTPTEYLIQKLKLPN